MQMKDHLKLFSVLAAGLLAGCSADDLADGIATSQDEIRLTVTNDWQYGNTRAATVYDNQAFPNSFRVSAYVSGKWTKYIDEALVTNSGTSWDFEGFQKYYWPMVDELNFFAYMPSDVTGSVVDASTISCTEAEGPSFSLKVPATSAGQDGKDEFIYAYEKGKKKENDVDGVNLNFKHPLAHLIFRLSKLHEGMEIKTITVKDVKTSGTFTHGATPQWSALGDQTDFLATINSTFDLPEDQFPAKVGGPYLAIPQSFDGGKHTIVVTFNDNGYEDSMEAEIELPKWVSGTRYVYDLTISTYLKVILVTFDINPWVKYEV